MNNHRKVKFSAKVSKKHH